MVRGRDICNTLKAIRKQIAEMLMGLPIHQKNVTSLVSARELAPNASKM